MVTSVHQPDDTRIRTKLIATLAAEWDVTYAARVPGPTDPSGLQWVPLRGGRVRRMLSATRLLQSRRWDLVAVHDPELIPAALIRAWLGRPTLFDLHENLPGQIRHKAWIPSGLRAPLAVIAGVMLRWASAKMAVTLAEAGYQGLFARSHPVIENYPDLEDFPLPVDAADESFLAYVGDITEQRGAFLAIEAAAGAGTRLVMVGRVAPDELSAELASRATSLGVALEMTGPLPHDAAMAKIASALAGLAPLYDVPNYRHSLPTKVLEYLALGLPVLAADLPGTREVVEGIDGVAFVEPGVATAWREAGKKLSADPGARSRAAAGSVVVRERYRWDAERVLAVYREAVSS